MKELENTHNEVISAALRPRKLTQREREVIKRVAEGYKNWEIAEQLGVKVRTVEAHRTNAMNKLSLRNRVQLIRYAIQTGLVQIEVD